MMTSTACMLGVFNWWPHCASCFSDTGFRVRPLILPFALSILKNECSLSPGRNQVSVITTRPTSRVLNCGSCHLLPKLATSVLVTIMVSLSFFRPLNGRGYRMLGTYSRSLYPFFRTMVEISTITLELYASLYWLFRLMAFTRVGFRLRVPGCARPMRSPPAPLQGVTFSFPLLHNFWNRSLGTFSRAVLNPGELPFVSLVLILLLAVSTSTIVLIPLAVALILSVDAKRLPLCRGFANHTEVGRGSRHPDSLTPCHLPRGHPLGGRMFRYFNRSGKIYRMVPHRPFTPLPPS